MHHTKSNTICIDFQKTSGRPRRGACNFDHEVIGKTAAIALVNYAKKTAKEKKESQQQAGTGAGQSQPSSSTAQPPTDKSKKPCRNWHNPEAPRQCSYGNACRFDHD